MNRSTQRPFPGRRRGVDVIPPSTIAWPAWPARRASRAGTIAAVTAIALAGLFAPGCAGDLRRSAVESTTRDWFATLRAAQVLPVYPLTEDLEPGDVFLVTVPIQRQHELYERDGYVPLDLMGARLEVPSPGYADFYGDRYWRGTFGEGPFERPSDVDDAVPAPRVVFPRLEVVVTTAGGLSVGLPLQAIPLGLELLGASEARVVVDLQDASTYALPADALLARLLAWARQPEVRDVLGEMAVAAGPESPVYLRCVTRVYLVRRVTVGIHAAQTRGQSLDVADGVGGTAGAAGTGAAEPRAAAGLDRLLVAGAPTASVRLRQAIGSTVLLDEDLGSPVVIGYLGFDVPIRPSGDLGPPVATLQAVAAPDDVTGAIAAPDRTIEERLLRVALLDLDAEIAARPERAAPITAAVARGLGDPGLAAAATSVADAGDDPVAIAAAVARFTRALRRYVADDGGEQARERRARRQLDAAIAGDLVVPR